MPLAQWLTTLGVTVSDSGVALSSSLQEINWWEAPLKPGCLRTLHEIIIMELFSPEEQVQLALVLTNMEVLEVEEIFLSPIAVGKDPRTIRLLEDKSVTFNEADTTPGFAALARKLGKELNPGQRVLLRKSAQSKSSQGLTAYLFEFADPEQEEVAVIQFQVDDISPEILGYVQEQALNSGALDYYVTPVQMKKNRPGSLITIMCVPEAKEHFIDLVFKETSTIGVRYHLESRTKANRHLVSVLTPYGRVRVKVSSWTDNKGKVYVQNSPEYEDCREIAQTAKVPLKKIYELALQHLSQAK
ncbi:MAG TPA: nickel insertion protein [Desulfobacteria bacterium]|nr:nickel insertion protein [Desulfobacteria bacterium]